MSLAGHAIFWIVFVLLGLICFVRAFKYGETGYDDDGATRDWVKFNRLKMWAWLGAGLILFPLIDMMSFFDIIPNF